MQSKYSRYKIDHLEAECETVQNLKSKVVGETAQKHGASQHRQNL